MKCPDTGIWQSYIDGEVEERERVLLQKHAESCPECSKIIEELSGLESWSTAKLTAYRSVTDEMTAEQTTMKQKEKVNNKNNVRSKGATFMKRGFKRWVAAAASILVLTAAFTMTPVQQAVADFLSIFRAQQIEVVQLDPGDMQQMAQAIQSKAGEVDLQQFGKVDIEQKPEQQQIPVDKVEESVPFEFKQPAFVPGGFTPDQTASVIGEGKSQFQFNVEQVNSLLKSLGSKALLPESLQDKTFSIQTPAIAQVNYMRQDGQGGFTLSQFESPEIIAPSGVDPNELRAALLGLPILPENLRTQLAAIEDWQHTMVLPSAPGKTEELTINSNKAYLAKGNNGDFINLIWIDSGLIYQMSGNLERSDAIKIANSLYQ